MNYSREKYSDDKYDIARTQISILMKKYKTDFDKVRYAGKNNDAEYLEFYNVGWKDMIGEILIEEWNDLVDIEIEAAKRYMVISPIKKEEGYVFLSGEQNKLNPSKDSKSPWQLFKNKILKEELNFDFETIGNIEKDTLNILRSLDNSGSKITKGLVVGGVQSGKTTNMAALMAMSSTYDYNLFIILSGTIENLRQQNEKRLYDMLQRTGKQLSWELVSQPKVGPGNYLHDKYANGKALYMVVLKNATRLRQLIEWLVYDKNIMKNINLVIIDDEADQASVNTARDPENDRKTINKLIVNLVHGKNSKGRTVNSRYKSVNYIGYTATPYANILSESPGGESLYPKDFIAVLSNNAKHFGPKEIFGIEGEDYEALPIIQPINDVDNIKKTLSGSNVKLPRSLKEAVAYFLAASASLRLHQFGKPVSMLIHLSNLVDHHDKIYNLINDWLVSEQEELLQIAESIWEQERSVDLDPMLKEIVYYDEGTTLKPHYFTEIKEELKQIIKHVSPIYIDGSNDSYKYHLGVHTIVDHSRSNNNVDYQKRLIYPTMKSVLKTTPIFLVIGGATLSRGLTLEGLITSYFLRTPSDADTLTQMGRWFGYRINYELYPRLWLTSKTKGQFEYISKIEYELREELRDLSKRGVNYSKVAPKILYSPYIINLTSKSKSYAAKAAAFDFTGFTTQTYIFDNNEEIQRKNIKITETFINNLGAPIINDYGTSDGVYWKDIPFQKIKTELLSSFSFNQRIKALDNVEALIEWIEKVTIKKKLSNWNVILAGKGKINNPASNWMLKHFNYSMVTRSKLKNLEYSNDEINIKALRGPLDMYLDLSKDLRENNEIIATELKTGGNLDSYNKIRKEAGMEFTPQLIIYKIDKNSKPQANSLNRDVLGINSDIIGLYIRIPSGDEKKHDYKTHLTVKILDNMLEEIDYYDEE